MTNNKLPYTAPALQNYGTVAELTGTFCLPDLGGSDTKNLGYPSDQTWKIIPLCDQPQGNDPSIS